MSAVRRGEVTLTTDGKESLRELYERMERTAHAYGRIKGWPVCEMDAVKISPARWGGFFNASAGVSLAGPDIDGEKP